MTQQALARKYRPQSFADLVGQEPIVLTLQNAISSDRIHHAYIFTGTRGVGKTSAARIFAKALNCVNGPTTTPCNECDNCRGITDGSSVDVMEIDAASHTKVEETRELMGRVAYAPAAGKYRVFIIDEAHMLSKSSFNALLKTLEEPPPHAIFILATTEPQKILDTVRSRCLEFAFRRITPGKVAANLQRILDAEGIAYDEDAVSRLAVEADGSMRDALSLTDQVVGFDADRLTKSSVESALGLTSKDVVAHIWRGIFARDAAGVHTAVQESYRNGADLRRLGIDLADMLRDVIVALATESSAEGLLGDVLATTSDWTLSDLHRMFDRLHQALVAVERSPVPDLVMETALLRLATFEPLGRLEDVIQAAAAGQPGAASPPTANSQTPQRGPQARSATRAEQTKVSPAPVTPQPAPPADQNAVLAALATAHPSLATTFSQYGQLDGSVLQVALPDTELVMKTLLEQATSQITATMAKAGVDAPQLRIETTAAAATNATAAPETPVQPAATADTGGKRALLEDERLRGLLNAFPGAQVVDVRRIQ